MSNKKAVLFFRDKIDHPDDPKKVFGYYLKKLRKYAKDNKFEITKEFYADEEIDYDFEYDDYGEIIDATKYDITSSPLFLEVLNFVKKQKNKVFVIC